MILLLLTFTTWVGAAKACAHRFAAARVELRHFDPRSASDCAAYRRINLEWLNGYEHPAGVIPNLLEPQDFVVLDHPVENVLNKSGQIWLAEADRNVIGAVAIKRDHDATWELCTVAVTPAAQGLGLGRRLVDEALAFARARGARRIILDSNSRLSAAIRLYESIGFKHLAKPSGKFQTADVAMELVVRDTE